MRGGAVANRLTVIIPVHNGADSLGECLECVLKAGTAGQVVVVNDRSTDGSERIAARFPAQVISLPGNSGPAAARNAGAAVATGAVLCFLDDDVFIPPDFLHRGLEYLDAHANWAALFASYTRDSVAENLCSRYKNLVHHDTHQHARREAITFCGGFGFIRRRIFEEAHGFDESLRWMEDIDLGYRLHTMGYRIRLCPDLQARHAKLYTLRDLIVSDFRGRAIPWTELMVRHRIFRSDLNLSPANLVSVPVSYLLPLSFFYPLAFVPLLVAFVWLNRRLLQLARKSHGLVFAAGVAVLHWLTYCLSALGSVAGLIRALAITK